ncbi:sodium:solute symporter family protein [Fulvivirgaceae bacterium BMA10]|uniref:Sodium:solute symporter family protein n=1 Tax=Splendidivirga corallicola TaxID=3051826 RepID=A0ABT8KJ83_9BACT|nr:sodium:solute symporter family protein [Fulvivirgaceae bacterium BMA10]
MGSLDTLTIIIFSLVVFITGISFSKSGKNIKSFFSAGGAVPWWINGLSLYMSFFSVGTFVVWGSIAYSHGLVAITIQSTMCLAGLAVGFLIAPRWNQTKTITAAQFISERLGENTQKLYTYLFLAISMFTTGAFLYPVAKIIEVSTGMSLPLIIILLGGLITIYTATGGLWAVLVTDVLQFIVLTAAVLIVVPLALEEVNGISGFINKAPTDFFALQNEDYTWSFIFAFGLYNMIYIGGNWAYVQRYTSVARPKDAKKVGWTFGILYLVSPLVWMLPPMIYKVLNPDLQGLADEGAYLMMCKEVLPVGLLGLILGGMIFATASSVNSTLNIAAGVFTNDLYKRIRPGASNNETMRIARLATAIFGALTIIIALMVQRMGGIVEVVLSVAAITGSAMFLPPIWALFSKRQNGSSIFSATVISLIINLFFKFLAPVLFDLSLSRAQEMILGVFCPVLVLAAFEVIFYLNKYHNQSYLIYQDIQNSKKDFEEETSEGEDNLHGKKVIAKGIIAIGIMMIVLGFLSENAWLLVSGMGMVICITGMAILLISTKNQLSTLKGEIRDSRDIL